MIFSVDLALARLGLCGCTDGVGNPGTAFGQMLARPDLGFFNDFDGAHFQRRKRRLRPFGGQRRADHHRDRVLGHELFQKGQAVHPWHFDVQKNDIRHAATQFLGGDDRVLCHVADLDIGFGIEQGLECLPNDGGIVDDHDLYGCHDAISNGRW